MKKVLIIDEDSVTRNTLSRIMKPHEDRVETLTAKEGKEALRILETTPVHLVVLDVQIPDVDGVDLLAYVRKTLPDKPIFAMTAFGTPELQAKINAIGVTRYFEKPLDVDVLVRCILTEIDTDIEGRINAVSLVAFMQQMQKERRTCMLSVQTHEGRGGQLFFKQGDLIAARCDDKTGEAAAIELVSWHDATIGVENLDPKIASEIQMPLPEILVQGLKVRQDRNRPRRTAHVEKVANPPATPVANKKTFEDQQEEDPAKQTEKFINALSEVLAKNPSIGTEAAPSEPVSIPDRKRPQKKTPAPSLAVRLSRIFDANSDILAYAIFDEAEPVRENQFAKTRLRIVKPTAYLRFAEKLEPRIQSGNFRYLMINTAGRIRYIFFQHKKYRIVIAIRSGFKIERFMRRFK